jgi:hypothetical protein
MHFCTVRLLNSVLQSLHKRSHMRPLIKHQKPLLKQHVLTVVLTLGRIVANTPMVYKQRNSKVTAVLLQQ